MKNNTELSSIKTCDIHENDHELDTSKHDLKPSIVVDDIDDISNKHSVMTCGMESVKSPRVTSPRFRLQALSLSSCSSDDGAVASPQGITPIAIMTMPPKPPKSPSPRLHLNLTCETAENETFSNSQASTPNGSGRSRSGLKFPIHRIDFSEVRLNKITVPSPSEVFSYERDVAFHRACRAELSQIYPFLYVSGDWVARNSPMLEKEGITHIINSAHSVCKNYHESTGKYTYMGLNLVDSASESIECFLLEACVFIQNARRSGGKCLVHCHMGISRSCTIVMAYAMLFENMKFRQAFDYVKARRAIASPNAGFIAQLMEWEQHVYAEPTQSQLYRVAPHSSSDSSLVVKLCYDATGTTPLAATVKELDTRGAFLVVSPSSKALYIWIGDACSDVVSYHSLVTKFAKWMQEFLPLYREFAVIDVQSNEAQEQAFWLALGVPPEETEQSHVILTRQKRYDSEYESGVAPEVITTPTKQLHSRRSSELILPHCIGVRLFAWRDNDGLLEAESQWEQVTNYDSDDLEEGSIFVLLAPSTKGENATQAFIWIGSLVEQKLNNDAAIELATAFIMSKVKGDVGISVEMDSSECDAFWVAFESGY